MIDRKLLDFCVTEHQKHIIQSLINGKTEEQIAAELGILTKSVHRQRQMIVKQAHDRHYAPEFGINRPLPPNLTTNGESVKLKYIDSDGNTIHHWLKSKPATNQDRIADVLLEFSPKPIPKIDLESKINNQELLTLYTITDYHIGMLATQPESVDEWDLTVAHNTFIKTISEMIDRSPNSGTAILNVQGDFLHFDGLDPVTPTHNHPLDCSGRFGEMVELSMDLISWACQLLAKRHDRVELIICEGNHDPASTKWLSGAMSRILAQNDRITVNDSKIPYYASLHGEIMLGFHHGHKLKNSQLPGLFSSEPRFRSMWGQANYTYIHVGHHHRREGMLAEHGGAIVERHPTLAARDAYAARGGWVSKRGANAITYHAKKGEVSRVCVYP